VNQASIASFENYVIHETDLHKQLREFAKGKKPLAQWRRAFLLDPSLQPTRSNIRTAGYVRDKYSAEWFYDTRPATDATTLIEQRRAIKEFAGGLTFERLWSDQTPEGQRHWVARGVPLRDLMAFFASLTSVDLANSLRFTGLQLQLGSVLQYDGVGENVDIYLMRPEGLFIRATDEHGTINQLFQGGAGSGGKGATSSPYAGDRDVKDEGRITVQIHNLTLVHPATGETPGVPVVATWVPRRLAKGWYAQAAG
jgi:hypothetical protein